MSKKPKHEFEIEFVPQGDIAVVIYGCEVGALRREGDAFTFYPKDGYCLGADEMIAIGQKMKEMEI